MRVSSPLAACVFGLFVVAPIFATLQDNPFRLMVETKTLNVSPSVPVIDEVKIVGLHHIRIESVRARLLVHPGEPYDPGRIKADIRVLNTLGWFEDISAKTVQLDTSHIQVEFHLKEYPFLSEVTYSGSRVLSQQRIKKLLDDAKLIPQLGKPADPVALHRVTVALQRELVANRHSRARVFIVQEQLPNEKCKVTFVMHDGPREPVISVRFSGNPQIPDKILRKQMREITPDVWLSGFRNKNVYTEDKGEQDRLSLLTYLQNRGFPQTRVGTPEPTLVNGFSVHCLPWFRREPQTGLVLVVPIEAGGFYRFGPAEVSSTLRESLRSSSKPSSLLPELAAGRPFSQHAVQSQQRSWELRLHRAAQRDKGTPGYRLHCIPIFDSTTHLASVKFDVDPMPPYTVVRIEFRGNKRFPDRYLRRRIGLSEGQVFDEYALEAGLARLARTGYFEAIKKQDVQIDTHEARRTADVTIHIREKGKQRLTFSGGREQFGSSLGIAYTVFNFLGMDEFLASQIDGGPETLQLAMSLAKEGVFGSRGTLALTVFDMLVRPRFGNALQGPFLRSQNEGLNLGWTYAASDTDAIGINYGISHSTTEYALNTIPANSRTPADVRTDISSHSVGAGWMRYSGDQKIQVTDSISGGLLGGNESLLKSKVEYGHIFPDDVFEHHNAWAFRTTVCAVGSYRGEMPLYARLFGGDDFVRGLRPGELGPYETFASISPSGVTTYSAVPSGAHFVAASNLEYRFPFTHGVEGVTFFDAGSGLLLPNWLSANRPDLLNSTNGLLHASTGFEVRWTLPGIGVPLRVNYSLNILRLNRSFLMPDGSRFRVQNRLGALGWGFGSLF